MEKNRRELSQVGGCLLRALGKGAKGGGGDSATHQKGNRSDAVLGEHYTCLRIKRPERGYKG